MYELYGIANPTNETSVLFTKTADRNTPNVIITSLNGEQLLLTPKSAVALRQWLQKEYMHGEDAESYYAMELAMEKGRLTKQAGSLGFRSSFHRVKSRAAEKVGNYRKGG